MKTIKQQYRQPEIQIVVPPEILQNPTYHPSGVAGGLVDAKKQVLFFEEEEEIENEWTSRPHSLWDD